MITAASVHSLFGKSLAPAAQEQARQESLAVSAGLKRQDAGLLDELIVRYQHRLMRYLLYLTGNREMAEDSSTGSRGSIRGCLPSRATW